tara:strand:+ start:636 stop:1694 length:1059 start_codon:yes stop_codon:yes gene_type:complete
MKILITGICGFVGSNLAKSLLNNLENTEIFGIDNLFRKGSELNFQKLAKLKIHIVRGDIRNSSDLSALPRVDWVIDCAANPSVLAGTNSQVSSLQLLENNVFGTINLLEYCKYHKSGFILISTSRVYSAKDLAELPVQTKDDSFLISKCDLIGISDKGLSESFPTTSPISLYGASKLASETLLLEYGHAFDFPVWINRCGVLAGSGQFGKIDQGIFSYWIHSYLEKNPLKYVGFNGSGHQVRDALHPRDLTPLLVRQMKEPSSDSPNILNIGGGIGNSMSLKQLSNWCENRFGKNTVHSSLENRPLDAPWIVMDSTLAYQSWEWEPRTSLVHILDEIADHAEKNPHWLSQTN